LKVVARSDKAVEEQHGAAVLSSIHFAQVGKALIGVELAGVDLHNNAAVRAMPIGVAVECAQCIQPDALILGRRDKYEVKEPLRLAGDQAEGVAPGHPRAISETCARKILADRFDGARIEFVEMGEIRAAAQSLDADAARTGEEIEEARPADIRANNVEERFFNPIHDGAGIGAGNMLQLHPAR